MEIDEPMTNIKGTPLLENAAHDYAESDEWSADMNIYGCLKNGFIAGANWMNNHVASKEPEAKEQGGEWISVNLDADIKYTDLQHFEQYFIVTAEKGDVIQAIFCDWQTEYIQNTWIIANEEYPLSFATYYQRVVYPSPPKSI